MNAPVSPAVMLDAIKRVRQQRAAETSLYEFLRQAWAVVEPGVKFIDSWHIEEICAHLEAVSDGDIKRLLINIPPRHSKSTVISVVWPMWEWISSPQHKYLCASYSGILSVRDNIKARRLVQSAWYQERWGHVFHLAGDQNQKTRFENDKTGYRIATSVGGTATGEGGSRLILDDGISAQEAQSDAVRASTLEWLDMAWSTRLNNPKEDAMVEVAQRTHQRDPSGHRLEQGGWEHICIPAEFDGVKRKTVLGYYDPRKKEGELICPERFGKKELDNLKSQLGEYGTAGQLQQRPSPAGGGIIKIEHFQQWPADKPLPMMEYIIQSYDGAFTKDHDNDPCGHVALGIAQVGRKYAAFILDTWEDWLEYPEFRDRVVDDWRGATYGGEPGNKLNKPRRSDVVLIEEKANGLSLIQDLRQANVLVAGYNPGKADKVMRAHQVAPILELDVVYIPESKKEPGKFTSWARPFVRRCELFPRDDHDDTVDCFTQAMIYARDKGFFDLNFVEPEEPEEIDYAARKKKRNPYGS